MHRKVKEQMKMRTKIALLAGALGLAVASPAVANDLAASTYPQPLVLTM